VFVECLCFFDPGESESSTQVPVPKPAPVLWWWGGAAALSTDTSVFTKSPFPWCCFCLSNSSPVLPFPPKRTSQLHLGDSPHGLLRPGFKQAQLALSWCWGSRATAWFLFLCKQHNAVSQDNFFSLLFYIWMLFHFYESTIDVCSA